YPDTRGRISTNSTASKRPVNSSHSFTSFSIAVTTLTGSGGCCGAEAFLHPPPAKKTSRKPTGAKKKRFIYFTAPSFTVPIHHQRFKLKEVFVGLVVRNGIIGIRDSFKVMFVRVECDFRVDVPSLFGDGRMAHQAHTAFLLKTDSHRVRRTLPDAGF